METLYYRILDLDLLAKEEGYIPYLYHKGEGWKVDNGSVLMDRLMGYDECEPSDSTYKIGNTDIMNLVEEITEEEALNLIKA